MDVFFTLFVRIIPLYFIILLGYIAGRFLKVQKEQVASLLIYLIVPVVLFNGAYRAPLMPGTLLLPILFFVLASCMCLVFYRVYGLIWKGSEKNILAFAAGTGNTGYFGIPVGIALFGESIVPLITMCIIGFVMYETTIGFFLTAKGNHTTADSLKKVVRLPIVYAFVAGLLLNVAGVQFDGTYTSLVANFQGALSVLGMMLVGIGMASMKRGDFDRLFVGMAILVRFFVWPALVYAVIFVDGQLFHLFTPEIHKVMILMSIVPLAANTVVFAALLKVHPEKAAMAVVATTLFALFYIPFVVSLFGIK